MSQDPTYFAARAIEERRRAKASTDPAARRVHLELAAQYALQAGANAMSGEGPNDSQRVA
jgi:hypothetical protein